MNPRASIRRPIDRFSSRDWCIVVAAVIYAVAWSGRVDAGDEVKGMSRLRESFSTDRFVAYTPTRYNPMVWPVVSATKQEITTDLATMRPFFSGLVTYSCNPAHGLDHIAVAAAALDFRVVLGVWDLNSAVEFSAAVTLARDHPETIVGIILGNETMLRHGPWETIERALEHFRRELPDVPLSTSEPFDAYEREALRRIVDFHAPNCHWIYHAAGNSRADPAPGVHWLQQSIVDLQQRTFGMKPFLLKEHGMPSGPHPFSDDRQAEYWQMVSRDLPNTIDRALVFMEAFDMPWKPRTNPTELSASEAHWGAWRADRTAKPVVAQFLAASEAGDAAEVASLDPTPALRD